MLLSDNAVYCRGFSLTRFRRHRVSRTRRTNVGAYVVIREGESIKQAMRRFRGWIEIGNRYPVFRPKPTKRRLDYFQKPAEVRHQRESLAKTRQRLNLNHAMKRYWYG